MSVRDGVRSVVGRLTQPAESEAWLRQRLVDKDMEIATQQARIAALEDELRVRWNARLDARHLPGGAP